MARNEAYADAFTFSLNSFDKLTEEEKIEAVKNNPEIILRLARTYKNQDSLNPNSLMYKLKMTAISQPRFGFLLNSFESVGLTFNDKMVLKAISTYPNLMREIDKKYLTKKNIHLAIKLRPALICYIPDEFMDGNMYQYCNKVLRLHVRRDEERFLSLPETIKSTRYSACNAFTNSSPSRALSFTKEQLNLNGGKIMYKIVRKEPNIILCMMPELLRKNLVLTAVTISPTIYEELPDDFKKDQTVIYRTYRSLKFEHNQEKIDEYFDATQQKKAEAKVKAWQTKQAIRARYNLKTTSDLADLDEKTDSKDDSLTE